MTLAACATGGGLARKDVLQQYQPIAQLSRGVSAAEAQDGALLASAGITELQQLLDRSVKAAQSAEKDAALRTANEGLALLPKVLGDMEKSRKEMRAVISTRQRADDAGAVGLFSSRFEEADKGLREACSLIERGDLEGARQQRPGLMERYAGLELEALKKGAVEAAKAAIAKAEQQDADDHAPALLKRANEELTLVTAVLNADRNQIEKANEHARNAVWLAQRAESVTELAKMFKQRVYDAEDMILWHQEQLDYINQPLNQTLPFNEPSRVITQTMRESFESLLKAQTDSRAQLQSLTAQLIEVRSKAVDERNRTEQRVAGLIESERRHLAQQREAKGGELSAINEKHKEELGRLAKRYQSEISAKDESERRRAEIEERYQYVQSLFTEDEAVVVRQKDDVLIQAQGFSYSPGRSDAEARNFGLLNKIDTAIQRFPGCRVTVSGHSDAVGGTQHNLALSTKRAAGVAEFLIKVGKLPAENVTSEGLGESRPVASNETSEGRAKNRRIEIRIVNPPRGDKASLEALKPTTTAQ